MVPQRWSRLNELFDAAIERQPCDVSAFLAELCPDDPELVAEVVKLLSADGRAGSFMATPIIGAPTDVAGFGDLPAASSDRIGQYRIVREIGRGGMGTVYLAERADQEFLQLVAIKLVKPGMENAALMRRFRNERQILASLEHPNIARLLDGGSTPEGVPYIVMEYIDGMEISEYCDAHRLTVRLRLELFLKVCAAIAFAHRRLVIHRDVKPSNILVMADGVPKLLDFGIAKIVGSAPAEDTHSAAAALHTVTLQYGSPEQILGTGSTTLSDIYSLGVVLYELIAGRPPYEFDSLRPADVAQTLRNGQVPKPSVALLYPSKATEDNPALSPEEISALRATSLGRLRRQIAGDLDQIVLKAMDPEPENRFQTVERLSEDIERYLAGRTVLARKATMVDRSIKFARRNRAAVSAAALVFLSILAGGIATTWQWRQAVAQEEVARQAQQRAERRFSQVRKLARSVLFDYHDAIRNLPGSTPVRAMLVKDALEYLDSLAGEGSDPELQRELAAAYERVGEVQGGTMFANLGDTAGAIRSFQKALSIRKSLASTDRSNADRLRELAIAHQKLGLLKWETGDLQGARNDVESAVSILDSAAKQDPANVELKILHAHALDYRGMILQDFGDLRAAMRDYRSALTAHNSLPGEERRKESLRRMESTAYEHLGTALLQSAELDAALENNRRALAIREALAAEFPDNPDFRRILSVSYYNDGEILAGLKCTREALASYGKDVSLVSGLLAKDPKNEQYRGDLAYGLVRTGDMRVRLKDYGNALVDYRKSRTLRQTDVDADPENLWKRSSLIEAKAKISRTLVLAGDSATAEAECIETLRLMDATELDPTNAQIRSFFAETYADLGSTLIAVAGRAPESLKNFTRARNVFLKSLAIWNDMQQRGILNAVDAGKSEQARSGLARCEAALGHAEEP